MASSSEGSREIDAAKKRLAAAKSRASADTDALESAKGAEKCAKKMIKMAKKSREDAQSRSHASTKELQEAEKFLKGVEERWEVVDIDDSDVDESVEGGSRKKQKISNDIIEVVAVDDSEDDTLEEVSGRKEQRKSHAVDEIVVEGCGIPGANGVYKVSKRKMNNYLCFEKEGRDLQGAGKFIIYRALETWSVSFKGNKSHPSQKIKQQFRAVADADLPPKDGWMTRGSASVGPPPNLKW